ncbi:MAG TPA: hypothetical protein VGN00_12935 [Puia sp.]|jgi:hypothetical protein
MESIQQRNELVRKYFIATPETPNYQPYYIGMVLFLLLFLLAPRMHTISGGLLGFGGIIGLLVTLKKWYDRRKEYTDTFKKAEPKATDRQMDEWLAKGLADVTAEARKRLDLSDDKDIAAKPLMIDGPAEKSYIAAGADRVLRFNRHNILLVFLTDHHVATFQCILDLGVGEILQDKTKEFPYKDITNLETNTTNQGFHYRNDIKTGTIGEQTFGLYTSGANVISVNYLFSKSNEKDSGYKFPDSHADSTIRAIRTRLKEYKDDFDVQKKQSF